MKKKVTGFTLVELLIVIAVISILVGIALPRFKGMQDEGNIAKAKGELKTLQVAVESYYMHNDNAYPTTLQELTSEVPLIVKTLPTDPFTSGSNYGYVVSTNDLYYVLYSIGPGTNGNAAVSTAGVVTQTNEASCIYVSNVSEDERP